MKIQSTLIAGFLLWRSASATSMPLGNIHYMANHPGLDAATREHANFTLHSTLQMLERTHKAIISGGLEGANPELDDGPFDAEQSPDDAADLARELAALNAARTNETLNPYAVNSGGAPGGARKARRHPAKRQAGGPGIVVFSDASSCDKYPPRFRVRETGTQVAYDNDVDALFENMVNVAHFYQVVFGRNSFDGNGGTMFGTVHFCEKYNNAIWDGVQMLLGDNDGLAYASNIYPYALDTIGHEFTHGFIQNANPLFYSGQSGALNEHLADVFGVMALQYNLSQSFEQASWLYGENQVVYGQPVRSLRAPGTAFSSYALGSDQQVATMANYRYGPDDNFGVHYNSGIPNHAFFLFCQAIRGYSWVIPGTIWYNTLIGKSGKFSYEGETFLSFAQKTIATAEGLAYSQYVINDLYNAWHQVGIYP